MGVSIKFCMVGKSCSISVKAIGSSGISVQRSAKREDEAAQLGERSVGRRLELGRGARGARVEDEDAQWRGHARNAWCERTK